MAYTHLSHAERQFIETSLNAGRKPAQIARSLQRDPKTIAREIKANRSPVDLIFNRHSNNCIHRSNCPQTRRVCVTCRYKQPKARCWSCRYCNETCSLFELAHCNRLDHAPFCCNRCPDSQQCRLTHQLYLAGPADRRYRDRLSRSRQGIYQTRDDLDYLNGLIQGGIEAGQSLHHICVTRQDELICSERTIYKRINDGLLNVRNIDLPLKVRRRPRTSRQARRIDRNCHIGRSYEDYTQWQLDHPNLSAVQMDTVVAASDSSKVLLTLFWPNCSFILILLRDRNTSRSVLDCFDALQQRLGADAFRQLFPAILT